MRTIRLYYRIFKNKYKHLELRNTIEMNRDTEERIVDELKQLLMKKSINLSLSTFTLKSDEIKGIDI